MKQAKQIIEKLSLRDSTYTAPPETGCCGQCRFFWDYGGTNRTGTCQIGRDTALWKKVHVSGSCAAFESK